GRVVIALSYYGERWLRGACIIPSCCARPSAMLRRQRVRELTQRSGIRMGKPRVYVTRLIPDQGLNLIRDFCDATVWEDELPPPRQVILRETRDADGLLSLLTDTVDGELMDSCLRLRVVSNMAVGFDNIDVPAATERGILAGNTPGVLTET